jgi:phosphatidylserine/phosphatidylglycerophosphate/cardiolipin synthase-like enzyme
MTHFTWMTKLTIVHLVAAVFLVGLAIPSCSPTRPRVYFSPAGGCSEAVVAALEAAEKEVRIAMFAISRKPIEESILRAKKRGVDIQIILDRGQAKTVRKTWERLQQAGIPIRFSTCSGYLHHKYGVFDGKKVITGSFNWTGRGETTNHENLLVLNDASLAAEYLENWKKLPCDDKAPEPKPKVVRNPGEVAEAFEDE